MRPHKTGRCTMPAALSYIPTRPVRHASLGNASISTNERRKFIMREKITHYIRAGYAGLYLVSHEEARVEGEFKAIATALNHPLYAWSVTEGLIDTANGTSRGCQDPMEILGAIAQLPENSIVLLRDYHLFFDDPNPMLVRQLKDRLRAGKTRGQ